MAEGELPRVQRLAIEQRFGSTGIDRIAFDGPIEARWTRIWCVRPVSRSHSRSVCVRSRSRTR